MLDTFNKYKVDEIIEEEPIDDIYPEDSLSNMDENEMEYLQRRAREAEERENQRIMGFESENGELEWQQENPGLVPSGNDGKDSQLVRIQNETKGDRQKARMEGVLEKVVEDNSDTIIKPPSSSEYKKTYERHKVSLKNEFYSFNEMFRVIRRKAKDQSDLDEIEEETNMEKARTFKLSYLNFLSQGTVDQKMMEIRRKKEEQERLKLIKIQEEVEKNQEKIAEQVPRSRMTKRNENDRLNSGYEYVSTFSSGKETSNKLASQKELMKTKEPMKAVEEIEKQNGVPPKTPEKQGKPPAS